MFDVRDEEGAFWKLIHEAFARKTAEFRYAPDVALSNLNDTDNEKPQRKISRTSEKRKSRPIIYSRSDDENPTISLFPDQPSIEKTWTIDSLNHCTVLHHIEEIPGVSNCMYYFGPGLIYLPHHVEDEDLASLSYGCEGTARVCYVFNPSDLGGF